MSQKIHTYGPTCHLAKPATSGSKSDDDVPNMNAQFFYTALYHIDDPLAAAPTTMGSDSKTAKHPPRPFTAFDNDALERAWLKLGSEKDRKNHNKGKLRKASRRPQGGRLSSVVRTIASKTEQKKQPAEEGGMGNPDTKSSDPPPSTKKSGKVKKIANALVTTDSEAKTVSGDMKKLARDLDEHSKADPAGNPFNSKCDDPHHVPLDVKALPCCDYEGQKAQPSHPEPKSPTARDLKPPSSKCEFGESQGDGTNDLVKKASRSAKEQQSSQSPATKAKCDMSSNEHAELQKHENSKEHQAYANHLHVKHPDLETSEPTVRKPKASDKDAASLTNSGLTNRPDQANDAGTTGRPFVKLPSRSTTPQVPSPNSATQQAENSDPSTHPFADTSKDSRSRDERDAVGTEEVVEPKCKAHKNIKDRVEVPIGISRLHKVCLPALQMEPIYWSPVNDVSSVTRGTWFYRDTMFPVEPSLANQLEMRYRDLRPWSQTWKDELRSAMEVGAVGEEKIAHRLWPKDEDASITSDDILPTSPYCAARCFQGEAAAEGVVDPDDLANITTDPKSTVKKYPNCQVIYKDFRNAFILKPNLQPSAYYKRRPLQKIQKGLVVGIPVCRGFDWKAWEKLLPPNKTNVKSKVEEQAAVSGDSDFTKRDACPACRSQEQRKETSDLCLVIHGIGQKLSERMESFHFTHAINAFRRSMNAEFARDDIQKVCRNDLGGVMVLPVNWRANLSFEDGNPSKSGESGHGGSNFSLKDITQPSIPAIRSMISDVMLDVPYYMSQNKEKMVQACICEANRVYRLWCKNNPDFAKNGRVHLIAHSLGSVMAMEILSKQPTLVPKVNFDEKKPNNKHLEFNTSNLFCVGSPAGFFLLLEKKTLLPRKGQNKHGADMYDDNDRSMIGEQGTFGCLAVENIYNVMHTNDPIAYRLNACADPQYAASLKNAHVPSATTGFFESLSSAMKSMTPGGSAPGSLAIGQTPMPAIVARIPSQLEMEVHDFTAEEKAEKRFYLLNDNGQVDYCLSSGGGPLEIQYLNMLSAHSSYWTSPDFIRMLCIEVGRKPGKADCLPNMKAVKIRHKP